MKKQLMVLSVLLILACQARLEAQMAVIDAGVATLIEKSGADRAIYYAQSIAQMIDTVRNTYQQVQMMIEAEKRALQHLKGIADVESWEDFKIWHSRQLYMEQQVERRYKNIGVRIGKKTYRVSEIDKLPDALRDNFDDPYAKDFTEEQREEMYYKLGLGPSNYLYVKTWQEREEKLMMSLLNQQDVLAEEFDKAAERNDKIVKNYSEENENLGPEEIAKESGITLSNIEMTMKDTQRLMAAYFEYQVAKDKEAVAPPTPPSLSEHYYDNYYNPIVHDVTVEYVE